MPGIRFIKYFLLYSYLSLFILSCSSSSYSSRYNKPSSGKSETNLKKNRFSSEEDPVTDTSKASAIYLNPSGNNEFDEKPVEDVPVDTKGFVKNLRHLEKLSNTLTDREKILFEVIKFLDTPYVYGGSDFNGIDCSAFTQNVLINSIGFSLPRTASEQYRTGTEVGRKDLVFGDLVFFNTTIKSFPGHVGIYLGDDLFAHASSTMGVTISSLKSTYFNQRFVGGRRVR
ncbi:MAG: C40 family peptidase [Melioribacteraceae bacterium]|nr:C40 family peptidase [Melioribacteraceae bacterium]